MGSEYWSHYRSLPSILPYLPDRQDSFHNDGDDERRVVSEATGLIRENPEDVCPNHGWILPDHRRTEFYVPPPFSYVPPRIAQEQESAQRHTETVNQSTEEGNLQHSGSPKSLPERLSSSHKSRKQSLIPVPVRKFSSPSSLPSVKTGHNLSEKDSQIQRHAPDGRQFIPHPALSGQSLIPLATKRKHLSPELSRKHFLTPLAVSRRTSSPMIFQRSSYKPVRSGMDVWATPRYPLKKRRSLRNEPRPMWRI